MSKPSARLFVILARNAPVAVIFRRGPSKQVQLIKWDLSKDKFEYGQWFKGRIYERSCDLSPNGKKLLYSAAKYKGPIPAWTAVSNPPYLTALCMWDQGCYIASGGSFKDDQTIQLDCLYTECVKGFSLPLNVKVFYFENRIIPDENPFLHEGSGYDPVNHKLLLRGGWELKVKGKKIENEYDPKSKIWIMYEPPITYSKYLRNNELLMKIIGIHEWGGPNIIIEYSVKNDKTMEHLDLGRLDWADWDDQGDLLYAKEGKLFRVKRKPKFSIELNEAIELADFNDLKFEEKAAPKSALKW